MTAPKIPRPAPCLCLDCNREHCPGLGKPLTFADAPPTRSAPAPRQYRRDLAALVIEAHDAGKPVSPELLRLARRELVP